MKIFFCALLLCLHTYSYADMKFCFHKNVYFTIPASDTINQAEYDYLVTLVMVMDLEFINMGLSLEERSKRIVEYLTNDNSPEARRLLSDLRKLNV